MSDKSVYSWEPFSDDRGLPLGGPVEGKQVSEDLFLESLPIEKAFKKWRLLKGVQAALNGTHQSAGIEYTTRIKRTIQWMENKYPLNYHSSFKKEELEELDVLNLSLSIPFINQKVIDILNRICPNNFEAFPIKLETPSGVSDKYFLINITNVIKNALDKPRCKYDLIFDTNDGEENSIISFERLLFNTNCLKDNFLGRLHENLSRILVSQKLIKEFQKENVNGMAYVILEDRINGHYRSNYMSDGKTLKY